MSDLTPPVEAIRFVESAPASPMTPAEELRFWRRVRDAIDTTTPGGWLLRGDVMMRIRAIQKNAPDLG
jgi:hypothetical protein